VTHSTAEINGQPLVKEYDDPYNKASNSVNIDINPINEQTIESSTSCFVLSGSEPNLLNRGLSPITLDESSTSCFVLSGSEPNNLVQIQTRQNRRLMIRPN
jgi:hypothetical protein